METGILHRVKAHLYDNVLTKDNPNDYIARVAAERSLNVRQICEEAVLRGGADISASTMEHAVNLWLREMAYQLCDGFSVNAGYFTANAHIRGVFNSPNEHFNPEKHTLSFGFQQGAELRKEIPAISVDILGVAESGLQVLQVTDMKTGSVNDRLTPGRNLRVVGHKLKIVGDSTDVGIRFLNQDNPDTFYTVATEDVVINNPSELVIVIPQELPAGSYRLEVTTQYGGNSKQQLKEPRTSVFDKILRVQ